MLSAGTQHRDLPRYQSEWESNPQPLRLQWQARTIAPRRRHVFHLSFD